MVPNAPAVVAWVEERTGVTFQPPYTSMGFVKNDRIVAGIVFHRWTVCDVEMGASIEPGGITRADLKEVADYVFRREKLRRVTLITPNSNKAAKRIAQRLGFQFEAVLKDFFPEEHGVMFRLRRHECRWL